MVENVSSRLFPWFAESSQDQDGDEELADGLHFDNAKKFSRPFLQSHS